MYVLVLKYTVNRLTHCDTKTKFKYLISPRFNTWHNKRHYVHIYIVYVLWSSTRSEYVCLMMSVERAYFRHQSG